MKSKEYCELRTKAIAEARNYRDSIGDDESKYTPDQVNTLKNMLNAIDDYGIKAERAATDERLEYVEAEQRQSQGRRVAPTEPLARNQNLSKDEARDLMRKWALAGLKDSPLKADDHVRANEYGFNLQSDTISLRNLSTTTNTAGGYTVPTSFSGVYETFLKYYFAVGDAVGSFVTNDGRPYNYPTLDPTALTASIVSEAASFGTSGGDPTFGSVQFKSWKYASCGGNFVLIDRELLEDSAFDLGDMMGQIASESIGRQYDAALVSSNAGTAAPEGILHSLSSAGQVTSNAFSLANLFALESSLDVAFRPTASMIMSDGTWQAIRQMTDANGRPLLNLNINLQDGQDKRLLGYKVHISNSLPNISSTPGSNVPLIVFGDFNRYKKRSITGSQLFIRTNELYAANDQVGFLYRERMDARWLNHAAAKTLNSST